MALLIPTVAIGTAICGLITTRIIRHAAKMASKNPVPVKLQTDQTLSISSKIICKYPLYFFMSTNILQMINALINLLPNNGYVVLLESLLLFHKEYSLYYIVHKPFLLKVSTNSHFKS